MNKIIFHSVILVALIFSFNKSFGKGCSFMVSVGGNSFPGWSAMNVDTFYNIGDSINIPVGFYFDGGLCSDWETCGINSITWTNGSGLITDTGTYTAYVNIMHCGSQKVDTFTINVYYRIASVITENFNPNIFQIYPNPTANIFTLNNISSSELKLLQIINPIGEIIYTKTLSGSKEYLIDEYFAKGIYFVRLNDVVRRLVIE